ncbi:MAG: hypothetical protein ACREIV_13825, partial [Planctomycetaceae bacterium]
MSLSHPPAAMSVFIEHLPLLWPCLLCGAGNVVGREDLPRDERPHIYPPESVTLRRRCGDCGEPFAL